MRSIILSETEMRICRWLAKSRQAANNNAGIKDRKLSDKPGTLLHLQGVIGEFVVAKYLNIYPELTTEPRAGGSELHYKGYRIDVKNRHPYQDMMTPASKQRGQTDMFVLVTGDNPYDIIGWCWEYELLKTINIRDFGKGKSYFLERTHLHHIQELFYLQVKGETINV